MRYTKLLPWIKGGYIIYMFNYFKTVRSFHHPFEALMTGGTLSNWLKHPMRTGLYENKICPLGNMAGFVIAAWFLLHSSIPSTKMRTTVHFSLLLLILLVSLLMNLNAFLYFLPLFAVEVGANFLSVQI